MALIIPCAGNTANVRSERLKPTVRRQNGYLEIVGDVGYLDPAQALLLARALLAEAIMVTDEDMEELKDQLKLHASVMKENRLPRMKRNAAGGN